MAIRFAQFIHTGVAVALVVGSIAESSRGIELAAPSGAAWKRHSISDSKLDGPDGTKLADIDGDGLLDVVTGFESEGETIVFRNPGPQAVRALWPAVTVGRTPKAEDATFIDLDADGALDVVTSSEQTAEQVFVHWGPKDRQRILDPAAWEQVSIEPAHNVSMWMFTEPIHLQPGSPVAIVAGGKNYNKDQSADIGLLIPGKDPRQTADYKWQSLAKISWVMSIVVKDLNGDGFDDILYSDKQGPGCGVWWLENPGNKTAADWQRHGVLSGGLGGAMFLDVADIDSDGLEDIIVPIDYPKSRPDDDYQHRRFVFLRRLDGTGLNWETIKIEVPPGTGQPKAITVGDVNGDGRTDLVVTSTGADGTAVGTYWLEYVDSVRDLIWRVHNIAGPDGIKYDLVHLIDLDADGDLDVLSNEEKQGGRGLGVFWYENELSTTEKGHQFGAEDLQRDAVAITKE
jgi:hypothetical protein